MNCDSVNGNEAPKFEAIRTRFRAHHGLFLHGIFKAVIAAWSVGAFREPVAEMIAAATNAGFEKWFRGNEWEGYINGLGAVTGSCSSDWSVCDSASIVRESGVSTSRENTMLFCSVFHYIFAFEPLGEALNGSICSRRYDLSVLVFPKKGLVEEFRSVTEIELVLDSRPVGFDGLHIQTKFFGDFLGAESSADQFKHLEFPVCQ
jgi:hypothetical protein